MQKVEAQPAPAKEPMKNQEKEHSWVQGIWQPPAGLKKTPIWPHGAPDMERVPHALEKIEIAETPDARARVRAFLAELRRNRVDVQKGPLDGCSEKELLDCAAA